MCLRPLTPAEGQNRVAEAKQLKERVENGSTPAEREAGLTGIVAFVDAVGQAAEPFVVPIVPSVLKALADKVRFPFPGPEQNGGSPSFPAAPLCTSPCAAPAPSIRSIKGRF